MEFVATCLFGIEGILGAEIDSLGYKRTETIDGRITFEAPESAVARCNIRLRTAERLYIRLASFRAETFDALFEGVKKIEFGDYIGRNDAFPVTGHSVRSKLFSIPDCQRIIKRAAVAAMNRRYGLERFEETGVKYRIEFFILNDIAAIMLDTSGVALHKRGYRAVAGVAPLRETLAAAMVKLSRMRDNVIVCDPMCGSGTIAVEAALCATNTAPGLNRSFAAEEFGFLCKRAFCDEREAARAEITPPFTQIFGSDIDPEAVKLAVENAEKAGVGKAISFSVADARKFRSPLDGARGTVIVNPPYGERMGDLASARALYREFGRAVQSNIPAWQLYIITSDADFERYFGRRSDKKRVLYNGMIKCGLFQYFKKH